MPIRPNTLVIGLILHKAQDHARDHDGEDHHDDDDDRHDDDHHDDGHDELTMSSLPNDLVSDIL